MIFILNFNSYNNVIVRLSNNYVTSTGNTVGFACIVNVLLNLVRNLLFQVSGTTLDLYWPSRLAFLLYLLSCSREYVDPKIASAPNANFFASL